MDERSQHLDSVLLHLAGGDGLVQLPSVRLGRVRPRTVRAVLHGRLEGLPHLDQRRLLRHLLLHLFHADPGPPHRGLAVSDHLPGVTFLLPAVRQRHPQQPAVHRKAPVHGE